MSAPERTPSPAPVGRPPESRRQAPHARRTDRGRSAAKAGRLATTPGEEFTFVIDARLRAALGVQPRPDHRASWRSRWTAPCAPATSRHASAPGRPPRTSRRPPRPPSTRSWGTPPRCWPSARTSPSAPRSPRCAARPASAARRPHPRRGGRRPAARPQHRPRDRRVGRLAARGRPLDAGRRLPIGESARHAEFVFDAPGRYVVADNDEARWLVGERPPTRSPSRGPTPGAPPARRRSPADDDRRQLPLGEDAIGWSPTTPHSRPFLDDAAEDRRRERSLVARGRRRATGSPRHERPRASRPATEPPAAARSSETRGRRPTRPDAGTRSCSAAPSDRASRAEAIMFGELDEPAVDASGQASITDRNVCCA